MGQREGSQHCAESTQHTAGPAPSPRREVLSFGGFQESDPGVTAGLSSLLTKEPKQPSLFLQVEKGSEGRPSY